MVITKEYAPGSLVHARGRDWVVLPPGEDPELLLLRPLGGSEEDVAGLYLPLEGDDLRSASLDPPDPRYVGDAVSAALLRDAVRLGFRSGAGPLRCAARIAVDPRPYQLVPLLMALRQDPVRLLIGDDVGIGKTIEAGLIARELYDRGEIRRLAVLCPPHLCEQWQHELRDKFHFDAVVVRPGTVARLERELERERGLNLTRTLFEDYPFVVVSIDYIKGDRRRDEFVRACPECVIVDEAHGVAESTGRGAQHQRHALIADLARDPDRHLIFTTATPHSGNQEAFASLIGLLVPELQAPVAAQELAGGTEARQLLAQHFVQRRRADIRRYLETDTSFPTRLTREETYHLTPAYRTLLEGVLSYAREIVHGAAGSSQFHQRVSWWAALALLRCASSSPAAAAAALRTRAARPQAEDPALADRLGAAAVFDLDQSDEAADDDSVPGADTLPLEELEGSSRARLLRLARDADALKGEADPKLQGALEIVRGLLGEGFAPIVFCRYIATAEYIAEYLRGKLRGVTVAAVTGNLPPEERETRVLQLAETEKRVLVATDCLSEGVNLQHGFDAVLHYDLAWNPTRHEQREGRVDRYGQPRSEVRTVMYYGQNNRVDGVVLEVLLRKAQSIRETLGVSVPVPADSDRVLEAIFDRLFDRADTDYAQLELFVSEKRAEVDRDWDVAAEREQRTRTVFAQHGIRPDEVAAELRQTSAALGAEADVRRLLDWSFRRFGAPPLPSEGGAVLSLDLTRLPAPLRSRMETDAGVLRVGFEPNLRRGVTYVSRSHPLIESLSGFLLDTALDTPELAVAKRAGAIRTAAVDERTVLLLLRVRYIITASRDAQSTDLLAEEALLLALRGDLRAPEWLSDEEAERLAREAQPVTSVLPDQARLWVGQVISGLADIRPALDDIAQHRAIDLREAHRRVRSAARLTGLRYRVEPKLPLDLLGVYVLMPAPVGGDRSPSPRLAR